MQKSTIQIWSKAKKLIATEQKTSLTTVQLSLAYYSNSALAKRIRNRAKEILIAEVDKIQE